MRLCRLARPPLPLEIFTDEKKKVEPVVSSSTRENFQGRIKHD